ncbi:SDR family oxidoreductase [Serratia plymuthica]|uniref:SDR family oxidoreductase n=1 Tax=Serratia TaxID=613 RepID=UPI00124AB410|nr:MULTISPECIES: SDR family oxidoreductase [Serratia]KAB1574193.1 SDR family oxidoreductase [Serratia marcescens]MCW7606413.1 SDR family oxidoreductase [Serratia bockelmannii]MDX7539842.1 SDR family oxidoreductase [Serratia marcescens]UJE00022.1 SDR family oxidoreductase [Serratia plymuthica]
MVAISHQTIKKTYPSATSTGARRFVGKTAVVIGASANVGRALAELLAQEGADVVIHYNSASKQALAEETAEIVRKYGQEALIFQADLIRPAQATALFDAAIEKFGKVDILINTAGKIIRKPLAEFDEAEFDSLFNVNTKAAFFLLKEASQKMADEGRILSFVTTMVAAFAPTYAGYAGSKAPLEHFSKALAKELGPRGITVNCIAPGPLDTSFFYPAESDENIAWLQSMSIDGGLGNIPDITGLALYLVSPEARWMTGTTSFINGGIISPIN